MDAGVELIDVGADGVLRIKKDFVSKLTDDLPLSWIFVLNASNERCQRLDLFWWR